MTTYFRSKKTGKKFLLLGTFGNGQATLCGCDQDGQVSSYPANEVRIESIGGESPQTVFEKSKSKVYLSRLKYEKLRGSKAPEPSKPMDFEEDF